MLVGIMIRGRGHASGHHLGIRPDLGGGGPILTNAVADKLSGT